MKLILSSIAKTKFSISGGAGKSCPSSHPANPDSDLSQLRWLFSALASRVVEMTGKA
ncbi:hypothetical protein [Pontibacter ruber]|uniref:Uncharacterized protein n=1 Tax=Pontibacter ruber TaxID=1343895 RepID=A0ABW5CTH0_9BACT|nr:hypothetical protein [Pontibacter ruber]